VGQGDANAFGLHDTLGNVAEWCRDWYVADFYERGKATDPEQADPRDQRVVRGGSWLNEEEDCRPAARRASAPMSASSHTGFRVCVTPAR
jgi:sulfatase modifying factor 1